MIPVLLVKGISLLINAITLRNIVNKTGTAIKCSIYTVRVQQTTVSMTTPNNKDLHHFCYCTYSVPVLSQLLYIVFHQVLYLILGRPLGLRSSNCSRYIFCLCIFVACDETHANLRTIILSWLTAQVRSLIYSFWIMLRLVFPLINHIFPATILPSCFFLTVILNLHIRRSKLEYKKLGILVSEWYRMTP